MRRGRTLLVVVTMIVVLAAAFAINGISGRYSLASARRERAAELRDQANRKFDEIPDSYRPDAKLVESATLSTKSPDEIVSSARTLATSMGLTFVDPDAALAKALQDEVTGSLKLAEAAGQPILRPVVAVVAVEGDYHRIAQLLEVVNRGTILLVLSSVDWRFTTDSVVATFALAGTQFLPKMPGRFLAAEADAPTTTSPESP